MTDTQPTMEVLIQRLERAGRHPAPELIAAIWERRAEAEPLLLAIFRDSLGDNWPDDDDPRWFRLAHAGKFLLSWQTADALPIFADLYADNALQDMCEWFEEDLAHYGPAAIPYLQRVLEKDSGGQWHYGHGLCGSMLTKIAQQHPETYDTVVAILRGILPPADIAVDPADADEMWAAVAAELGQLADEGSRAHILALADRQLLEDGFFERSYYLRDMNRGFRPQKPDKPYDLREEYRQMYEWQQTQLRKEAAEQQRQRQQPIRQAQPRTTPKAGRNAPCPCGSGKKYKKCHGRPGQ